jgi:hypothetical protein
MSERVEAKRDGAKLQRNSGRGQYAKGDAIWMGHVVDYKEYEKSFSVSRKVWAKVTSDAMRVSLNMQPLLRLVLGSGNKKLRLTVVDSDWFDELVEVYYERQSDT